MMFHCVWMSGRFPCGWILFLAGFVEGSGLLEDFLSKYLVSNLSIWKLLLSAITKVANA